MTADSELVEVFRRALLAEHADEWSMETVSEAAHICAAAAGDVRRDERHRLAALLVEHGHSLACFTGDAGNEGNVARTVALIAYLLRLDAAPL